MNKFMKIAIAEARRGISSGQGGPFGAVIVKDGKVISSKKDVNKKDKLELEVIDGSINVEVI